MLKLENQKEIIFETAKEILLSKDITKFSIRMISTKCNIGLGTIYKYYGNKTDILIDITKDFWMNYITYINSNVSSLMSFTDRIEFYYFSLVEFSNKFNYHILSKELSYSFRQTGKKHHNKGIMVFNNVVMKDVRSMLNVTEEDAKIFSDFICNNLVALITMENYEYTTFRKILTSLLKTVEGENK
jgi:AcrR family transcriptional regulator